MGLIMALNQPELPLVQSGAANIATKRRDTPEHAFYFGLPFGDPLEIDNGDAISTFKFGLKLAADYPGDYVVSNWDGAAYAYTKTGPQHFADAVLNTTTLLTSATAAFTSADIGAAITGNGIPAGTTIAAVVSATNITLSAAATASATGVAIAIARDTAYTVAPSYNTDELNDAFITGTIGEEVADQAARYALTGKAEGYIVKQVDNSTYWTVIDADELDSADGWERSAEEAYVDLIGELEIVSASGVKSSLTWNHRVLNDVNQGGEGVPTEATPSYPTPAELCSDEDFAISAAGDSPITIPDPYTVIHHVFAIVAAGAGAYTRTLTLPAAGRRVDIYLEMPASVNPTIEVRNETSGGTLLHSQAGEATARNLHLVFVRRTSATDWKKFGAYYL